MDEAIASNLRDQAQQNQIRLTLHAQQEMRDDLVDIEELLEVLQSCVLLENYPEHQRGACCLVCGKSSKKQICSCRLHNLTRGYCHHHGL